MSKDDSYETEFTAGREEIAAILSGVTDGVLAGSVRLGEGPEAVTVATPDEMSVEIEFEVQDDEASLELELEWSPTDEADAAVSTPEGLPTDEADAAGGSPGADDEPSVPVEAADAVQSLARFEVFRDRGREWRWRLRHRNGNVIATSGEGYTRKHNARKGLRSVVRNAPDAEVADESIDRAF